MFSIKFVEIFILIMVLDLKNVNGNPLERNIDELTDLNVQLTPINETISDATHQDNKQGTQQSGFFDSEKNFKFDVEILESNLQNENNILEERFRGSGIDRNTDSFTSENIEFLVGGKKNQSHFIVGAILIMLTLFSIGLYIALVLWRSHLEKRYGMRELLIQNENEVY